MKQMSVQALSHAKGARAFREGALVLEQFEVHCADVVLQVEGGGEVGLAVRPRTHQHGLVGGVEALVSAQHVTLLKLLVAEFAGERDWMFCCDVLLKSPPGAFKDLAVSARAVVTCMCLLMGFSRDVGVERGSASVFCAMNLHCHIVLL